MDGVHGYIDDSRYCTDYIEIKLAVKCELSSNLGGVNYEVAGT